MRPVSVHHDSIVPFAAAAAAAAAACRFRAGAVGATRIVTCAKHAGCVVAGAAAQHCHAPLPPEGSTPS